MRRLLIRPGAIGDCILSLPAMECLKTAYLEVWAASPNLPLVRFADRVRSIASTGLDLVGLPGQEPAQQLLDELRGFDSIVSWYGMNRPEFRDAVEKLELPFRFLPALPPQGARTHAADFYLRQAREISDCVCDGVPRIDCPRKDEGYAVIHAYSGSARKNWPIKRFRQVAEWLSERMPVAWCAGPNEDWKEEVRIEDLYRLARWLAASSVYVGNDSGITHLAAAAGAPVVALFGPTDPAVWAPRGNVQIVATKTPGQPMDGISVEDVLAALRSFGIR